MARLSLRKVFYAHIRRHPKPGIKWCLEKGGYICLLDGNRANLLAVLWSGRAISTDEILNILYEDDPDNMPLGHSEVVRRYIADFRSLGTTFGFKVLTVRRGRKNGVYQLVKDAGES